MKARIRVRKLSAGKIDGDLVERANDVPWLQPDFSTCSDMKKEECAKLQAEEERTHKMPLNGRGGRLKRSRVVRFSGFVVDTSNLMKNTNLGNLRSEMGKE